MKSSILITHENYEGSISSTLRTRSLRRPSRMLARNWKHLWLLLCPAKLLRAIRIVGVVHPIKSKQNLRVFWKPVNLQDCVWENHCRLIMKTILQGKETKHWRKFRRGTWRKSEVNRRWSMKQGRRAQKFISPHWWTHLISRILSWRQSTKNTKVELYSEVILWKTILALMQYSLTKDHQHHIWQQQSHGYHLQTAGLRRTSRWRSICSNPGKKGGCTPIIENSQIGMCRHLDSPTTTQMVKIMVQYGRSSRSSWAKSVRSSFGRTVMGKAIWENPVAARRRFPIGNAFSYTVKKGCSHLCVCGWHQIGWKETKYQSDVESTQ